MTYGAESYQNGGNIRANLLLTYYVKWIFSDMFKDCILVSNVLMTAKMRGRRTKGECLLTSCLVEVHLSRGATFWRHRERRNSRIVKMKTIIGTAPKRWMMRNTDAVSQSAAMFSFSIRADRCIFWWASDETQEAGLCLGGWMADMYDRFTSIIKV